MDGNFSFESILQGVPNDIHEDLYDSGLIDDQELGNLFQYSGLEYESFLQGSCLVDWDHSVNQLSDFDSVINYLEFPLVFNFFNVEHIVYYTD